MGRIKLELWRVVRRESPMRSYSFSSMVANLLKRPFPELQLKDLIKLYESNNQGLRFVFFLNNLAIFIL